MRIRLPSGRAAIADIAFVEQRVVIEVDGKRAHGPRSARFESDRSRQNELVLLGWRVIRVTWAMMRDHPERLVAELLELLSA